MTRANVVIRPAEPDDAPALGRVHFTSWQETYTGLASADFWERASVERSAANWERWLADGVPAWLAEVDGEVVGLAMATAAQDQTGHRPVRDLQLYQLYVLAAHHGTGVGQALLEAVLPDGVPAQLWVADHNPRALRFYERNGFVADGAYDDGRTFGGIAALRMVR